MVRDHGSQIDIRQHVAVENDRRVVDVLFGILEGPPGAERRSFNGISDPNAIVGPSFRRSSIFRGWYEG
jgi:hypothetical protein